MTEYKLFTGNSYVSTYEYHKDRERAPHLEQPAHRPRLFEARNLVRRIPDYKKLLYSDLGCGDGGFLQLLHEDGIEQAWGYDFCPANAAGWVERGVTAHAQDWTRQRHLGQVVILTEVLEHLQDPHGELRRIARSGQTQWIVASSPANESDASHCESHSWAWDYEGFANLFTTNGWSIVKHTLADWSQLVLAWKSPEDS